MNELMNFCKLYQVLQSLKLLQFFNTKSCTTALYV